MANYNKITYKGRTIKDEDLAIGGGLTNNMMLYQALIGEELKPDTFTFNLIYDKNKVMALIDADGNYLTDSQGRYLLVKADDFNPENMTFGDPLMYYVDNGATLVGRWYVRTVRRVQKNIYRFECTSGIGMTTYYGHDGGIYNNDRFSNVIASLMGNIPYSIQDDLAREHISGWLPRVASARDNLQAILFSTGACVQKGINGSIYFGFPSSEIKKTLEDVRLSIGGSIAQLEPATRVEVMAHSFIAASSTAAEVLFDNTESQITAYNQVVEFNGPHHTLIGSSGITISERGVNYAVVSGIGTLTGKPYVHTTSVYATDTEVVGQQNVIRIDNNYVINPENVMNVAKRIAGYYGISKEVSYTFRMDGELPGDRIAFTDPFGDHQTGHIKSMNATLSKRLNAQAVIALNWTPGPFGSTFEAARTFTEENIVNGRLSFPADMVGSPALVLLFGGAGGGQAGFDGQDGADPKTKDDYDNKKIVRGGFGGNAGNSGERGNLLSFYVDELPAYYDGASIGVGGAGGTTNGEFGQPGTATTLGGYSSDEGAQLIKEFTDILTGGIYGDTGNRGTSGGNGGNAYGWGDDDSWGNDGDSRMGYIDIMTPVIYPGGEGTAGNTYMYNRWTVYNGGAGGGGAARGEAGEDGQTQTYEGATYESMQWSKGGDGGDAMDVDDYEAPQKRTDCGHGGNGGGGGGAAALCVVYNRDNGSISYGSNTGGAGGAGGAGGKGGDGLIVIHYVPQN